MHAYARLLSSIVWCVRVFFFCLVSLVRAYGFQLPVAWCVQVVCSGGEERLVAKGTARSARVWCVCVDGWRALRCGLVHFQFKACRTGSQPSAVVVVVWCASSKN